MNSSLFLGRLAGIKVYVHWTFLLLIAYIVFQNWENGWADSLFSIGLVIGVFTCVVLHELGHALSARRYGIGTHNITLLPIGGVAQLESMPTKPFQELVVAIAGPLVNVAIAALLFPYLYFVSDLSFANIEEFGLPLSIDAYVLLLFLANLLLVAFNLIPAFPMDGGRVLRALLAMKIHRLRATKVAARIGQFIAVLFVIGGFFYNPFWILIGAFVFLGAMGEERMVRYNSLLEGYRVGDLIRSQFTMLPSNTTVQQAANYLLTGSEQNFLVGDPTFIRGALPKRTIFVTLKRLYNKKVDLQSTYIQPHIQADVPALHPQQTLESAFQLMQERGYRILPVMDEQELLGVLDMDNLREFLAIREVTL